MAKVSRLVKIVLWVLILVSAVLVISLVSNISSIDSDPAMGSWISNNLTWSYILLIACAGVAIIFSIIQMFLDKRSAIKGLSSLGFMAVVVLIAYLFSSDVLPQFYGVEKFVDKGILTPKVSQFIDTGLYATYLLFGLAVVAIIWSGISQLLSGSKK